jgi:stage III sporulation protein AB
MLKLTGAILILFAGTMIGFYQASRYSSRPRQIRQLILCLQRLETEILYGYTPLPDALRHIGKQAHEPVASIFLTSADLLTDKPSGLTAQQAWQHAVETKWHKTFLKKGEKETMYQLGYNLGISDRDDQVKHLRLAMSQLKGEEQTAREEQQRYEKMWKSLGALAGALVVILMY